MNKDLQLEIITPEKILFDSKINLVEVPGQNGRFTILRNHAPIISVLTKGQIRVQDISDTEQIFDCIAGYIECAENKITILLNS